MHSLGVSLVLVGKHVAQKIFLGVACPSGCGHIPVEFHFPEDDGRLEALCIGPFSVEGFSSPTSCQELFLSQNKKHIIAVFEKAKQQETVQQREFSFVSKKAKMDFGTASF
jgi:hypothetical protein